MYHHKETKCEQKIKENFNFVFLCKKKRHTFAGDGEDFFLMNYLIQRQIFLVAMKRKFKMLKFDL